MKEIEVTPTVNDLANLLAESMRRPLSGGSCRPHRIHVRGNPRWKELIPHLKEVGVEVVIQSDLPKVNEAYNEFVRDQKKAHSSHKIKPTAEQQTVEDLLPAITQWVRDGHIEIGDQEGFGFIARALDYGGQVFEDDRPETMAALEDSLRRQGERIKNYLSDRSGDKMAG